MSNTSHKNYEWTRNFITFDNVSGNYTAWDETSANVIGIYKSYANAEAALLDYARHLQAPFDLRECIEELSEI